MELDSFYKLLTYRKGRRKISVFLPGSGAFGSFWSVIAITSLALHKEKGHDQQER